MAQPGCRGCRGAVARIRAEETRCHGIDFDEISDERLDAIADALEEDAAGVDES